MPWRPAPRKRIRIDAEPADERDPSHLSLTDLPLPVAREAEPEPALRILASPPAPPAPTPMPTRSLLAARAAPAPIVSAPPDHLGYELLRHVCVRPELAIPRFNEWRPRVVQVSGAVLEVVDRTDNRIGGRLHRRMQRDVDIELALETGSAHWVVIRLTPDLHRRRWSMPTDRWWNVAHGVADAAVAVVRARSVAA